MKAFLFIVLLMAGAAFAQAPSDRASREIAQLFDALRQSDCQFLRNGSWHDAQQAGDHLQRKYDYLLKRNLVTSAESFIELAASRSSVSGKPYQVRCGDDDPVSSQDWFMAQLAQLRK